MTHLTLGDLTVTGLMDIQAFDVPLTGLLPQASAAAMRAVPWLSPQDYSDGILHLAIRSWLLRIKGQVILIDTCVGEDKERPHWAQWHRRTQTTWMAALAAEGLGPQDVDIVMCTHLHADHVGWNTRLDNGRWVPTFPNARYICGKHEFEYWQAQARNDGERHGSFADSVLPVMEAGVMDLVEDGWDLGPGLTLGATPGHTPGHMCIHAKHGRGAVFSGDVIHAPVQLAYPQWSSAFCADAALASQTRQTLLQHVADAGQVLIPAHFSNPGWVCLAPDGDVFRPVAVTRSS